MCVYVWEGGETGRSGRAAVGSNAGDAVSILG